MLLPRSPFENETEIPFIGEGKTEPERQEIERLDPQNVLVVCWAGRDRSRIIAEELIKLGYTAQHKGAMANYAENKLHQEDLSHIDVIIFVGKVPAEKAYKNLDFNSNVPNRILKLVEGDHSAKIRKGGLQEENVRAYVRQELEEMGFRNKNNTNQNLN